LGENILKCYYTLKYKKMLDIINFNNIYIKIAQSLEFYAPKILGAILTL
jgi:hypothetical protein